jgi:hypothetical protein
MATDAPGMRRLLVAVRLRKCDAYLSSWGLCDWNDADGGGGG